MKHAKHTPGPWGMDGIAIRPAATLTYRPQHNGSHSHETLANAQLISAAPEMLEALQLIINDNRLMNAVNGKQALAILTAIAKATGGAE